MALEIFEDYILLWKLPKQSSNFTDGYIYGYLYAKTKLNAVNPKIYLYENKYQIFVYDSNNFTTDSLIFDMRADRYVISNKYTRYLAKDPSSYYYWVAVGFDDDAYFIRDTDGEFMNGLINGAKHANFPVSNILLTLPFKDGQWFQIEGLNLRYPDDI